MQTHSNKPIVFLPTTTGVHIRGSVVVWDPVATSPCAAATNTILGSGTWLVRAWGVLGRITPLAIVGEIRYWD
jgi:tetrahydromethanopterin S-methyltransferase subunit D